MCGFPPCRRPTSRFYELELELIQTQITQMPMLRVEEYARALRASQNVNRAEVWSARDAPYGWAGRVRLREWKALVLGGVISEVGRLYLFLKKIADP